MNGQTFEEEAQRIFYHELSKYLKGYKLDLICGKRKESKEAFALRLMVRTKDEETLHTSDFTWLQIDRVLSFEDWERSLYYKTVVFNIISAIHSGKAFTFKQ